MIPGMALDTGTVLVLAAIALIEGIARVPAGALIVRRRLGGSWDITWRAEAAQLRLVDFWPPWTETLVVRPTWGPHPPTGGSELLSRINCIKSAHRWAVVAGLITQLALIIGIPAGIGIAGAPGGLAMLGGVIAGQIVLALLAAKALRRLGTGQAVRKKILLSILNPFSAPAVSSRLMAEACAGATPLVVARALLPEPAWARWFRPRAYDALARLVEDTEISTQLEEPGLAMTQVLGLRPVMGDRDHWCPRCGATYQPGFTECRGCEVRLLRADESFQAPRSRAASAGAR